MSSQRALSRHGGSLKTELPMGPGFDIAVRGRAITNPTRQLVSDLSYAGDEGGIVCHIVPEGKPEALIMSLTHVRVPRTNPLAAAVLDYQKHRIKKLKKQGRD
jgi:hypothetical protein